MILRRKSGGRGGTQPGGLVVVSVAVPARAQCPGLCASASQAPLLEQRFGSTRPRQDCFRGWAPWGLPRAVLQAVVLRVLGSKHLFEKDLLYHHVHF